mgnify:CR=1 FL=1
MSAGWTTVKEAATASFVERKSEFIGHITPVKTEEEAIAFVNKIKKQYADAKHNVYAYLLRENNITRFSDDGEPHGTAGLPVLDVLRKEGVTDAAVVVTRYFGGILLGTGGLVRAYSQGAKMALDAAGKSVVEKLLVFSLRVNYSDLQKAEPILDNQTLLKLDTVYADDVTIVAAIREAEYPPLEKALTERTNGRAILKVEGERFDCI